MRLLDTTTKQLRTFYDEEIPKYVILSHMWGREEDEVLFRHIAGSDTDRRKGEMRKGYAKIEGACKQAVEDGWKYIWIDTCCIDKESSAELSEAINSMYEWYRNAEVCYVYLEDVRNDGDVQLESDKDATFPIVPFERSRWFSRGWTLQELMAPQYVVFYSKNWVDIGTKGTLRDTISATTRIRVGMLMAKDPRETSVAERMSWAAFRKTTRSEDIAYCLMGLLGVNMPLLYGEGNRAFRRLQEELMKVSDDDSLFAWKGRFQDSRFIYDQARGMLADTPWNFRDGMTIVRSRDGAYSPYSMTNQGLQIKLPLLPIDLERDIINIDTKSIFKTHLKCTLMGKGPTRWIVIYLKMTREGYYQRIFPHWLDRTEIRPNETELTSLLVPQVQDRRASNSRKEPIIEVKILPTMSGFTVDGHSLVDGYTNIKAGYRRSVHFQHPKKHFTVVIGSDDGFPWLDFTNNVIHGREYLYSRKGGSRVHVLEQRLDRLSKKIPGEDDWWVTVSVRKIGDIQYGSRLRAAIVIQEVPIQLEAAISVSDSSSPDFPADDLNHHDVHPEFKKEDRDWFVVFNPRVKRVFDISQVYTLQHKSSVKCVQFSCDDRYLATGSDAEIQIYNMKNGVEMCTLIDEPMKKSTYTRICFSLDNTFLATGDLDGRVKIWNIHAKVIHKVFKSHRDTIRALCFSADGRLIISGSMDGRVRIWDIANGTSRILIYPKDIWISHDGRLVAGNSSGITRIWNLATTQLLAELQDNKHSVYLAFTPDGKGLVSGSEDTLKYWNISGLVSAEVERKAKGLSDSMNFTGQRSYVRSAAVSRNGRWVISGSETGYVSLWDMSNGTAQFMLKKGPVHSGILISPGGNMSAAISNRKVVQIWRYNIIENDNFRQSQIS